MVFGLDYTFLYTTRLKVALTFIEHNTKMLFFDCFHFIMGHYGLES